MNSGAACITTLKKKEILLLYKKLMRYTNSLKYSDKNYYVERIRGEFWRNKELTDSEEIHFQFQLRNLRLLIGNLKAINEQKLVGTFHTTVIPTFYGRTQVRYRHDEIDRSKVPVLDEKDLEEWFITGNGPGGSNVNKRENCCSLRHKPSGIILKCHVSRELDKNRKMARIQMIEKLDQLYNGEDSVMAQKERILQRKLQSQDTKSRKIRDLKTKYKELMKDDDNDNKIY